MATNTTKTKRTYGKERTFGDIIYNPNTKSVFCSINLGFFGKTTVTLIKRADDNAFDLMKSYTDKQGQEQVICVGKTFPAKRKDGTVIEEITKGTLGLLKKYDNEKKKEITDSSDALFITTHKLKERKPLGETGLLKIGFITGMFGIEIEEDSTKENTNRDIPEIEIDEDEIPF